MSKFKAGDRVQVVDPTHSLGVHDIRRGEIHTISEVTCTGAIHLIGKDDTNYGDWRFKLAEESELERLVRVANEGWAAIDELAEKYFGEYESGGNAYNWEVRSKGQKGWRYRVKQKPKFEPFTVGSGWTVKLEGETLYIGCKSFPAKELKDALIEMGRNGRRGYPISGSSFKYFCTRQGVSRGEYGELVSWADADKILAALEKAGIK